MAAARRLGRPATPSEAQSQSGPSTGGVDDALIMPSEAQSQGPADAVDALTMQPEAQSQPGPSTDGVDTLTSLLAEAAPYLQGQPSDV